MKTIFFFLAALSLSTAAISQTSFGITAGYINLGGKSEFQGTTDWEKASGFYAGILADVSITENFHLKPGLSYASVENIGMLYLPFMAKFYPGISTLHLQAGPQLAIVLDEMGGSMDALGVDIGFGAGYDISSKLFLEARYALEITNRISAADVKNPGSPEAHINTLQIGLGYKF